MKSEKQEKVNYNEITGVSGVNIGMPEFLIDEQLEDLSGGLSPYKLLLKDAQITACYQQRFNAFIAKDWHVVAGGSDKASKKATQFLKEQIANLNWDDINYKMAFGRHYGYAIAELMFIQDGNNICLDNIYVREQSRFDIRNKQLFLLDGHNKKKLPTNKFWLYICGGHNHDTNKGLGLAYQLYWPAWFKKHASQFWAIYIEKFASPTAKGKYPRNADEKTKDSVLQATAALSTKKAIAMPEGAEVELIEATRTSGGDYDKFLAYWDGAIAKIILGQKGTTEVGQHVGTAQAHTRVASDIIKSDADLLCGSFNNGAVKTLINLNYPEAKLPKIWRNLETIEDRKQRISEDKELFAMGWRRSDDSFAEIYGSGFECIKKQEKEITEFAENNFANRSNELKYTDTEDLTDKLASEASPYLNNMLEQIRSVVFSEGIANLEQLADRLQELGLSDDEFNQVISDAMSFVYLKGAEDETQ